MVFDINKLLEIVKDPDLKIKINDLYGENLKLKEENYTLKKKFDNLKEISDIKRKLVHEDNHYFINDDDKTDGPFCTKCWDSDNKLIRIHKGGRHDGVQHYSCPNCKTPTSTGSYIQNNNHGGVGWS